jgi:beta-lactamase superfamily II metal-dependent hydrolase
MKYLFAFLACCLSACLANEKDGRLDVVWTDVEGGAATLIVTPKGESILIDSGNPGVRDPGRIHKSATEAGLKKIDHYVTTHFHGDHFGGAAELAALIPLGTVWDNGIPEGNPDGKPNNTSFLLQIKPYREMKVEKREVIKPGQELPLKQLDGPKLSVRCLMAKQKPAEIANAASNECGTAKRKEKDPSDNANSVVLLVEFGKFQMFVGGDLTWNVEETLVCPKNLVGEVDVYQVTHHGLDVSNNPLVLQALKPTVSVMSNGTTKGCEAETFATLKSAPSIKAMYQIHRNLRQDSQNNTAPELIANLEKECQAVPIKMTVSADASNYTISIPGKKESERTFQTR